ncbi:hypothetical protein BDZ90DRAFT_262562 [Jaminaea rosea]|uniref:Secreted protein n=1 Tax=Jaminaea rosea TaxID=1569628 RepID=A0A316UMG9_9BASI|nr:hypothetical protein BDZ90DRAFT_262562 [Jaminaea rosea]PWN25113.1 hypothetical protein BDZ90DRAFT_262562 [Jaminaea rosea]
MACPVQSQWFHIVVFILGALVVLSRYVRGAEVSIAGPATRSTPSTEGINCEPLVNLAAGVGSSLVTMAFKRATRRSVSSQRSRVDFCMGDSRRLASQV